MSAVVDKNGRLRQLDGRASPDEVITPEDAADTSKLSRLLIRILRELAAIQRRWWPRIIDFEDVVVDATGTTPIRLSHALNGRVRWWVVGWDGAAAANLRTAAATDNRTLVLTSTVAGTATIRVEAAG